MQHGATAKTPGGERGARAKRRAVEMVEAAAKVFARLGYHGASTQDIADVMGIRQGSIYYYFASKEAALEAVCAEGVAEYEDNARCVQRSTATASEKVAKLMFHHLAPLASRPDFTLTFLRERRFLPAPARKRIRAIERRYERIIQRVIEQGIASGEFHADLEPRMAALALLGLANSAALWFGREPGATLERITTNYADLLVRGFRAGPAMQLQH